MKHTQIVTIEVNGKRIEATVTVDAPGLDVDQDCLNARMILAAVASGQNTTYHSRHHKDRAALVQVAPMPQANTAEAFERPRLRRVA